MFPFPSYTYILSLHDALPISLSFVTPREIAHLQVIQKVTKSKIKRIMPPTNKEAQRGQQQVVVDNILGAIEKKDLKPYHQTATELLDQHDSVTLIAAALSLMTKERRNVPVKLSSMQPISVRGGRGQGGRNRRSNNKRYQGKRGQGGGHKRKGNFSRRRGRNK